MKLVSLLVVLVVTVSAMTMECEVSFTRDSLKVESQGGFTAVSLPRCASTWDVGAPSLPIFVAQLVIPQAMRVVRVSVTPLVATETIPCLYDVWPVQEPRPVSDNGPASLTEPDPRYYGEQPYPSEIATAGKRGSMFGYNIASVFVAPVQYTASQKTLVFHPALRLEVELVPDDYVRQEVVNRSEKTRTRIEAAIQRLALNPGDVSRYAP